MTNAQSLYSIPVKSIDGSSLNLADFKGKKNPYCQCSFGMWLYTAVCTIATGTLWAVQKQAGHPWLSLQRLWRTRAGYRHRDCEFCKKITALAFRLLKNGHPQNTHALYQWLTQKISIKNRWWGQMEFHQIPHQRRRLAFIWACLLRWVP